MNRMKTVPKWILLSLLLLVAGCATTGDLSIAPDSYQPSSGVRGGSGEVWLAASSHLPPFPTTGAGLYVVGEARTGDQKRLGDLVLDRAPQDLVADVLEKELTAAGFVVKRTPRIPKDAARGVEVILTRADFRQTTSLLKGEASADMRIGVILTKNGAQTHKLGYQAGYTDTTVRDKSLLVRSVTSKLLQGIMNEAVPEIVGKLQGN